MQQARAFHQQHRKTGEGEGQGAARVSRVAALRALRKQRNQRKQQMHGSPSFATEASLNGPEGFQTFRACGENPEAAQTRHGATVWR